MKNILLNLKKNKVKLFSKSSLNIIKIQVKDILAT